MNSIFDEVKKTLEERKNAYGDASEMHHLIADYWSTYLDKDLSASDVAVMMTLFKIARSSFGDNFDTADDLKDAIGYMGFAAEFRGDEAEELFDPRILGFEREDIENMPTLEEVFVTPSKEWQESESEEVSSVVDSEALKEFYARSEEISEKISQVRDYMSKLSGEVPRVIDVDGAPHVDNGNGFVEVEEKYRKSNFEYHLDNVSERNREI